MEEVVVERTPTTTFTEEAVRDMLNAGAGCMGLHNIDWVESLLAADGHRMICRMRAPDAESVRLALRQANSIFDQAWSATVHVLPPPESAVRTGIDVVVERSFPEAVTLKEIQAIEDAGAGCLETHAVTSLGTLFSRDRRRMVCLYRAPDAESVRLAQQQAGVPFDRIWAFHRLRPAPDSRNR